MREKQPMEGDKALSHLLGVPAGSGGSVGVSAQLTGAGGTEKTRGIPGYRGSRLAAEPVGMPRHPAAKLIASGPGSAGCSPVSSPSSIGRNDPSRSWIPLTVS